jgi:uncharacterized protein (UPF0147 family)
VLTQEGKYKEALALLSGEDAMSYYNRWVIKTLTAYDQASGKGFSWLELASTLSNEALHDFVLAKNLQKNTDLDKEIAGNIATTTELAIVINAKTCYVISTETISGISGLQNQITTSQWILRNELQSVQTKSISADCKKRWTDTIQQSQQHLGDLRTILTDQEKVQQTILSKKRTNPSLCLQTQDTRVLKNIQKTEQKIGEFLWQHQESLALRNSGNPDAIAQLCKAKDDAQINQGIENTINQLLSSLKDQDSSSTNNQFQNNQPNYVPLDANEEKLLESIDKKNKIRIRQLQRLKTDPEYSGMNYIQTLFNEFYGNTWDFSN